jgi:ribosomal protein S18 acetylase RimI-like enzyme
MSSYSYPDTVAGPYERPPQSVLDREGRQTRITRYDGEFEAVVAMYDAFDPADRAQGIPPIDRSGIREWLEMILGAEPTNVLASQEDSVVGHATLVPDGDGAYELAIFVLSSYQEAGIGTALMKGLLGAGRATGIERVWLSVERWNTPAITLYQNVGFRPQDDGGFDRVMTARLASPGGESREQ